MEFYPLLQTYVDGMQSVAAGKGEVDGTISIVAGDDALSVAGGESMIMTDCF